MKRLLFIDDQRQPPSADWMVVRSFVEALAYFDRHGIPERISFDHDLGEADGRILETGMDIAKAIVEGVLDGRYVLPRDFSYEVHSANPVGRANIIGLMGGFLRTYDRNPLDVLRGTVKWHENQSDLAAENNWNTD